MSERRYHVEVSRSYSHTGFVIVRAESAEEASEKALEDLNDVALKLGELIPGTDEVLSVEEITRKHS